MRTHMLLLASLAAQLTACGKPLTDPDLTGILIRPIAGEHIGPLDVGIRNQTGGPILCQAWDIDECPAMDDIGGLDPGETWSLYTDCIGVDVACWREGEPTDGLPHRAWTWSVKPDPTP